MPDSMHDPDACDAMSPPDRPNRRLWLRHLGATAGALALSTRQARASDGPQASTVVRGLQNPWGLAFMPDFLQHGLMLVTERRGRLVLAGLDGRIGSPVGGLPEIDARGQGGLLDVAVDPQHAENKLVYFSFSEPGPGGTGTAVARARLEADEARSGQLRELKVIFRQKPKMSGSSHFGSRLVFGRDGKLFITLGDRFSARDQAQALDVHLGKVVRIEPDGRVPGDNPFLTRSGALPEIWSYGHRNVQGAAVHPQTGELWTHEHGPQGGDEVNLTLPGRNYGWPVVTFGREYGLGTKIGEGTARADVEPAATTWVPSIAPSGMAFVTGSRYPGWSGSLMVGALRGQALVRLQLDGRRVVREERLLTTLFERIRDVRMGPDGWIYLLTDNSDGRLLRLEV